MIYRIIEDNHHRFWISTNQGIFSVYKRILNRFADGNLAKLKNSFFSEEENSSSFLWTGGGQPSGWKNKNGFLYFPTNQGLIQLNPDNKWFKIKAESLRLDKRTQKSALKIPYQKVIIESPARIEIVKVEIPGAGLP